MKHVLAALLLLALSSRADARDALGVFGAWGAFRDSRPVRCFAVAEPAYALRSEGKAAWRSFASVATWPKRGVRNQLHFRLAKPRGPGTPLQLNIDGARFDLVSAGVDAWAADARADAAIVAAMRSGRRLLIVGRARDGSRIEENYALDGAATAIDAATLACAKG